jgi:dihydrofolate reductase
MTCELVVAIGPGGVIGKDGEIPWHLPSDLKRFKAITWGHPIVMGRRTHESIGRPLPGRLNVVLSGTPGFRPQGCVVARSPAEAIAIGRASGADRLMIVGGERLYREFLPRCSVMHLTEVEGRFDGDARFPIEEFREADWTVEHLEDLARDDRNPHPHRYRRLRRRATPPAI